MINDFEDLEDTILDIQYMFKNIPPERIREHLLFYVNMRRLYTKEDLIYFVKTSRDLNNI